MLYKMVPMIAGIPRGVLLYVLAQTAAAVGLGIWVVSEIDNYKLNNTPPRQTLDNLNKSRDITMALIIIAIFTFIITFIILLHWNNYESNWNDSYIWVLLVIWVIFNTTVTALSISATVYLTNAGIYDIFLGMAILTVFNAIGWLMMVTSVFRRYNMVSMKQSIKPQAMELQAINQAQARNQAQAINKPTIDWSERSGKWADSATQFASDIYTNLAQTNYDEITYIDFEGNAKNMMVDGDKLDKSNEAKKQGKTGRFFAEKDENTVIALVPTDSSDVYQQVPISR